LDDPIVTREDSSHDSAAGGWRETGYLHCLDAVWLPKL
jgi:hypothetical protein